MRHRNKGTILGRERAARTALLVSVARSVLLNGAVTTTLPKAKAVRTLVERSITVGKTPTLAHRRTLIARLRDAKLADHVIKTVSPKFATRPGGYTRIIKLGTRLGDGAQRARLELVA